MVIKKLSLKADGPQELKRKVIDMRITKVSVENLFGRFNHTIELKLEEHITIIHSPNGLGKTVLLKMLFNLFHRNYEAISEIPFDKFRIDLDTDSYILCEKGSGTEQFRQGRLFDSPLDKVSPNKTKIVLTACKSGGNEEKFTPVFYPDDRSALRYLALRADSIGFDRVSSQMWRNAETAEIISTSELVVRLRRIYPDLDFGDFSVEPKLLTVFLQSVPIHFIETQRLLNTSTEKSKTELAVETYARELARTIQQKLAESVALAQSLDRTFPTRLVDLFASNEQPELSSENLDKQLNALEEKRTHLIDAGLLDKDENKVQIYQQTDERMRSVLSFYMKDVEEKLDIYSDLANRIDLFKEIINSRFSYKKLIVNKKEGFRLETDDNKPLNPKNLSSGEQHELVLLYELLFKVQPYSLILIDEPEISLHIGWQEKFLDDLREITKISSLSFDVLIATHSPQLISDCWDLTVELKGRK